MRILQVLFLVVGFLCFAVGFMSVMSGQWTLLAINALLCALNISGFLFLQALRETGT